MDFLEGECVSVGSLKTGALSPSIFTNFKPTAMSVIKFSERFFAIGFAVVVILFAGCAVALIVFSGIDLWRAVQPLSLIHI